MSNTWEQPQLHLAKPQKNYYSVLRGVKNFQPKLYLNNISEISFRVYEYENGEINELYNELEETQLIEALDFDVEWFQIVIVNEKKDDVPVAYKDITCNSLEDELIAKTIYDLNGVFSLYNIGNPSKSIMHVITNNISWNIGYISPTLVSLYRSLSIDSGRIYSLLTNDLSKSFNCIFKFSREYKTISVYTLDEIGFLTDIVINEDNLLKSWEKNSNKDKISTTMRVIGGTSTDGIVFDIRKVNFGSDTISNYSYFKPRMSNALQAALSNWESAIDNNTSQYNINIDLLKAYNSDLNTLNDSMNEIKAQISAQDGIMNLSLKTHYGNPPSSSDSDYTNYQNAINQLVTLNTQKANKQIEIDNKNSQIASVNNTINTISYIVDKSNFFTTELLNELDCFTYVGDDYTDETFLSTTETTSVQEIQMALELKANAEKELHIACRPQPEFKATLKNLWSLHDEKDSIISYDIWREKFKLGNLVTVMLNDESWTTLRIIGIEPDYENRENAEVTFSTRTRLDNSTFNLAEIQAQASRAYSAVTMNKYSWNTAASQTSSNEAFRSNVLMASNNKMQSDPEGKVEFGTYGIKCRDYIESEKAYGLSGMWLNPHRMIFTSDGFKTAGTAYGSLLMPDGSQHMGINTEYLMGKISMTQYTYITNASGNYVFDDSGFTATATVGANTYSAGINPSTPSEIINVKVNGVNQLYIDVNTNKLIFNGTLSATAINAEMINALNITADSVNSDWVYAGNISATQINAGTISGDRIYGGLIQGATLKSVDGSESNGITTTINYQLYMVRKYDGDILNELSLDYSGMEIVDPVYGRSLYQAAGMNSVNGNYRVTANTTEISLQDQYGYIFAASNSYLSYKGYAIVTSNNIEYYVPNTNKITASNTGYGNIDFQGFDNACGVNYAQATFAPIGASDVRLKYNIQSLANIPDELFFALKPKQFKFKTQTYGQNIHFGLIAQEVESAFETHGLNPYEYDMIELKDVKPYSDDGMYVKDETHRIHYNNLIAWTISIVQKQQDKIKNLEDILIRNNLL